MKLVSFGFLVLAASRISLALEALVEYLDLTRETSCQKEWWGNSRKTFSRMVRRTLQSSGWEWHILDVNCDKSVKIN